MYFTNLTTATALAIVAMAVSHFALIRVAAAPITLPQADYLRNGQDAQKLNKQFQTLTVEDRCKDGETGCIAGNFAACSPENDWEVSPCPSSLKCFALPLVKTSGTAISCTTEDDALAWIEDTGATGGIDGGDSPDDNNNNNNGDGDSSTLVATSTTADVTGTQTTPPTATSAPAASDIPEFSIPIGDNLSDVLLTTSGFPADTASSTTSSTSTSASSARSKVTSTPALSDIPGFSLPVGDNLSDVLSTLTIPDAPVASSSAATSTASERSIIRVTTTVTVTPTGSLTNESSIARGTATASTIPAFTTHSFSPIPVLSSTSACDKATSTCTTTSTSTSTGYATTSAFSSAAPLTTASSTSSLSFITQTATQLLPIGGTLRFSDLPPEDTSSSTTSFSSTSSSEPSIPPLAPRSTSGTSSVLSA